MCFEHFQNAWMKDMIFYAKANEFAYEKPWIWFRKINLKRETEYCMIRGKINKVVNHMILKCEKHAHKKSETRDDWATNLIHWNNKNVTLLPSSWCKI